MSDQAKPSKPNTRSQTPGEVERLLPRLSPGNTVPGISSWVLEKRLGGGGFGEVWLVKHEWNENEKPRAVKFCTDPEARTRLVTHEKTVVVRVMKHTRNHPNIVPLLECNLEGEFPWLMYEFVEGGTLADALPSWKELPLGRRFGRVVRTLHAIARALASCHKLDPPIVHRDIKPHNVLMAGSVPRVTDFGLSGSVVVPNIGGEMSKFSGLSARLPTMLQAMGTFRYAPPEQFFGSAPNPSDDVYAIGITAYQLLLCDLAAAPGTDANEILRELRVPPELITLVLKSVAMDPARRIKDASVWETKLTALLPKKADSAPVLPTPPVTVQPPVAPGQPGEQKWRISARGEWYSRLAGNKKAAWKNVTKTPAEIVTQPGEVYRFNVLQTVNDADLAGLSSLKGLTALQILDIRYLDKITDMGLMHLEGLTSLQTLNLFFCQEITDAGLMRLANLTSLQTLILTNCEKITDDGLAHLKGLTSLRTLALAFCDKITDAGVSHLKSFASLQSLSLADTRITDAGLLHLKGLASLQTLKLDKTKITDDGLAHLKGLASLQTLTLSDTRITNTGVSHLKSFTFLQTLELRSCRQLTDAGVSHLRDFTSLRSLSLADTRITDAGLLHLKGLTFLQTLKLGRCEHLTDAGVSHLKSFTSLQTLHLDYCGKITDAGLAHLKGLTSLRTLRLGGQESHLDGGEVVLSLEPDLEPDLEHDETKITDAGLAHLKGLTSLRRLYLTGCHKITDAGLAHLKSLTFLRKLSLYGCKQITNAGIAALKEALLNCEIER